MSLRNRTLFITGASRGIGLAIALRAARDGANVAVAAKTADPHPKLPGTIHTAARAIEEAGGRALPLAVDVRDETAVAAAVEQTVAEFGGIDILVNNASAISLTGTLQTPVRIYDRMMTVNARGTFVCSQACLPHLKRSSNLGMAREFEASGIAVNALWPRTAIATAAIEFAIGNEAMLKFCRKPEIVADAAYTILCNASRERTGQFLIDDEVLAATGVTDFDRYQVEPGAPLVLDFFLDEQGPYIKRVIQLPGSGDG
jgi:citronellol/citronellal dehydrogenase